MDSIDEYIKQNYTYYPETGQIVYNKNGKIKGTVGTNGYTYISIKGKQYLAHRLAWLLYYGKWPDKCIDHINRIRADNRIINLRNVSRSTNSKNVATHKDNETGFKGVSIHRKRNKKYQARYLSKTLGYFNTAEDAASAILDYYIEYINKT